MSKPKVLILRSPGANCDRETEFAFELAGASADRVHINRLRENANLLLQYQMLVIPGGFSFGDDISAGKILGLELSVFLGETLRRFRDRERLILGICNGFQALLKAGLLLPPDETGPLATLALNDSGKFEDRWICLHTNPGNCTFLKGYSRWQTPVASGEARFVCREPWILRGLEESGQAVLKYVDSHGQPGPYPINPNGSEGDIAGICDVTGRVLGMMPHPERHVLPTQHPQWTRHGLAQQGDGLRLFRNAVEFFL